MRFVIVRDMSKPRVYSLMLEVKPLPGCEVSAKKVAGAFVQCFTKAQSPEESLKKVKQQLTRDRFELIDVEWNVDYQATEWEEPDDRDEEFVALAGKSEKVVVYGRFNTWPVDKPPTDAPSKADS